MASVRDWMEYSYDDLNGAKRELLPRHACFNAQQSAEKAIKAALIAEGSRFQYTHDLMSLLRALPSSWSVKNLASDLSRLVPYAVETRYPDTPIPVSPGDAQDAINTAEKTYDSIDTELRSRGL